MSARTERGADIRRLIGRGQSEPIDEVFTVGEKHCSLQRCLLRRGQLDTKPVVHGHHAVAARLARRSDVVDLPPLAAQVSQLSVELVHCVLTFEPGHADQLVGGDASSTGNF